MAVTVTIWHNPRCSKSRQTLALLQDRGVDPNIRLYLQDPPTEADLREALVLLNRSAADLVRSGEAEYREEGLGNKSDEALIAAMVRFPKLIERPVVFAGGRAAIGRPPETVLKLLG